MKILLITLLGLIALGSCKKKYACECVTTKSPNNSNGNEVTLTTYPKTNTRTIKDKKDKAEAECKSGNKVGYEDGFYEVGEEPAVLTTVCEIR
ncbi:MAG: hypothetical protein ACO1N0_05910 [Fluviicola sp.]